MQMPFSFFKMKIQDSKTECPDNETQRGRIIMLLRNIRFICRHYFRSTRSIFIYLLLSVAAMLLIPLSGVYLPRVVVQAVTEDWEFNRLALYVVALTAGIALLNVLSTISSMKYSEKASHGRMEMMLTLDEVMMSSKYHLVEDPAWQIKIEEAGNAIFSDGRSSGIAGMVHTLRDFVVNMAGIFTFAAILGILHPMVLVILVLTSLIPGLVANRVNLSIFKQRENWLRYDKQIDYIYNHITGTAAGKEIRLYRADGFFLGRMAEAIKNRLVWGKKTLLRCLGTDGVSTWMLMLQNGIALGWIAAEIIQGKISVAEFTFYSGAAIQFAQFMNRFVGSYSTVKQCGHDVQRVQEAFAWLPEKKGVSERVSGNIASGCPAPEIRFEHLTFAYPGTEEPVLKDISFCVRPGEKIALVGANGAGKSTIVKLLCGLYQPTEGRILIDGIPTSERKDEELYSLFSTVFQDKLVLPFSVLENVAVNGKPDVEKVRRCLEKAGLSQRFPDLNQPLVKGIQDGAENLSGGEEQKLLLARALYKEAPILVLDEPTAALDPLAESELYEKYNEFTQEKTSFFISHRLASTGFCDRILLLGNGRILEEGSHKELLAKGGQYAHMFREQSKYYKNSQNQEDFR